MYLRGYHEDILLLAATIIFIAINLYVKKDIGHRFGIMNISNPLFAAFSFGWALAVTYSDVSITGTADPVLFMTFSLTAPLSIFLLPYMYAAEREFYQTTGKDRRRW